MMNQIDRGYDAAYLLRLDLGLPANQPTNLELVVGKIGAQIKLKDLGSNILGACRTDGMCRKILIHSRLSNDIRYRFTLSHEIGHLIVHHGSHYCKPVYFDSSIIQNAIETEANSFAAELLMHKIEIINTLQEQDLDIELIRQTSSKYQVSLTSATIRLMQLYNEPAMAIFHDGAKIALSIKSADCFYWKSDILLPTGFRNCSTKKIIANPRDWLSANVSLRTTIPDVCEEETLYFSRLNRYLTIVKFIM